MECATSTGGDELDTSGVDISYEMIALVKRTCQKRDERLALEEIGLPLDVGSSLRICFMRSDTQQNRKEKGMGKSFTSSNIMYRSSVRMNQATGDWRLA